MRHLARFPVIAAAVLPAAAIFFVAAVEVWAQQTPSPSPPATASWSSEFFSELGKLLNYETLGRDGMSYLVFAGASGAISLLVFLLDLLVCAAGSTRKGFLGINHGFVSIPLAVVWFAGGAIAGILGYLVRLFEATPTAAVIAGVTWRTFLTRLTSFAQKQTEDVQRPPGT
jgi:hypothetical protein